MKVDRRAFLAASAATATVPSRLLAAVEEIVRPEEFGARGDGVTNDTRAFAALSAEVNRRGGGTISLRAERTYLVGAQHRGGDLGWTPSPIIELKGLPKPLRILGNGARLRCPPGLLFGTFDLASGAPVHRPMPNLNRSDLASPYRAMILVQDCAAPVEIHDVELDGNSGRLRIGGQYGDTGWQIPATGLHLVGNRTSELIENFLSHHHAQDGAMFIGSPERTGRTRVSRLICRYNGRQGLSITDGRGYDLADCEFSHTGRGAVSSAPGGGVDIEAEHKTIRDLTFTRCKFIDNHGCGMVADSGDSEGARFTDCLFVGTTSWSAWPLKPHFSFAGCTFVGAVVHAFSDPDPARAAHFFNCRFTDDPKLSPTGEIYTGYPKGGPIVNLAVSDNVLFDRCTFDLVGSAALPWSWRAIYRDCTMRQRFPGPGMPKGRYLGHDTISGNVNLYGSMIEGVVIVNGKQLPRGSQGGPAW